MKLAIMQPYFFPYLGYIQLMAAADCFVIYDDVNFIKRGWVNRNSILSMQGPQRITLELIKASQNKLINEIEIGGNRPKILRSIELNYKKAPFFDNIMPYVQACMAFQTTNLSCLLKFSLTELAKLLDMNTEFLVSSELEEPHKNRSGPDRILALCKTLGATHYINAEGGADLYTQAPFTTCSIELSFLRHCSVDYGQFSTADNFVPYLSVIDALMFLGVEGVKNKLSEFELFKSKG